MKANFIQDAYPHGSANGASWRTAMSRITSRQTTALRACAALTLTLATRLVVADVPVEIQVEVEGNDHLYTYNVVNHARSPVICVDLPHYRGDVFQAPNDWTIHAERFASEAARPGRFVARTASDRVAIGREQRGAFSVRIAHVGAPRGRGIAIVILRDERRFEIPVECAVPENFVQRNTSLIGMFAAVAIFMLFSLLRARRKRTATGDAPVP